MTCRVSDLTSNDLEALTGLIMDDGGYSMRVFGRPPKSDAARDVLHARPPGLDLESKITIGLWDDNRLIGVADAVRGYPRPEVMYVGLLQVGSDSQGRGVGRMLHEALDDRAMSDSGITTLRLSIVATNAEAAEGFWRRLGYEPTREAKEWVRDDGVVTTAHVYERSV
ncbi:MAG: GNAT family N-acetyltransferase [Kocuria sp.]|nr:GNAT family N-acetyltransferase [Kocuria sp.]